MNSRWSLAVSFVFVLLAIGTLLLFGGKPVFFECVVLLLAVALYVPDEGFWIALLAFALGVTLVPQFTDSEFGSASPEQFLYWGGALVAIASAIAVRALLDVKNTTSALAALPRDVLVATAAFAGVVVVAIIRGASAEDGLGAGIRQSSGSALMLLFMLLAVGIKRAATSVPRNLRYSAVVVLVYAAIFVARYLPANLVSHTLVRDRSPMLFYCGLMLACGAVAAALRRGPTHVVAAAGLLLLIAIVVSTFRSPVLAAVLACAAFALCSTVRRPKRLLLGASVAILCIVAFPWRLAASALEATGLNRDIVNRFVVSPQQDSSLLQRASQLVSVYASVRETPWLGKGLGASLTWWDPANHELVETAFIDSGIGFMLLKFGVIGSAVFLWWIVLIARLSWKLWRVQRTTTTLALFVTILFYVVYLPFGPAPFQFLDAFWLGTSAGFVLALSRSQSEAELCPA